MTLFDELEACRMRMVALKERQVAAADPKAEATREIIWVLAHEQDCLLERAGRRGSEDFRAGRFLASTPLDTHVRRYWERRGFTPVSEEPGWSEMEWAEYRAPFVFHGPGGHGYAP